MEQILTRLSPLRQNNTFWLLFCLVVSAINSRREEEKISRIKNFLKVVKQLKKWMSNCLEKTDKSGHAFLYDRHS